MKNLSFLLGQYAENETNVIHFRSISSQVRYKDTIRIFNYSFFGRFLHVSAHILPTKLDIQIQQLKYLNFQLRQNKHLNYLWHLIFLIVNLKFFLNFLYFEKPKRSQ
jgi:hypothetical protein